MANESGFRPNQGVGGVQEQVEHEREGDDDQGNNQRKRPRVETPGVSRQELSLIHI